MGGRVRAALIIICRLLPGFIGRLKKAQRRLSKRFKRGQKQSKNYHKQRKKVALIHLKISRQRLERIPRYTAGAAGVCQKG